MKSFILALTILMVSTLSTVFAQEKAKVLDLPDISVIGNMVATSTEDNKSFDLKELEISFQHYLYPSVKADIFTAIHKEEDGSRKFELEEAYVTFSDVLDVLTPNTLTDLNFGAIAGKKLIGIGKTNPLHPEQRQFVDRPIAIKTFFGQEHGLSGEGAQVSYLLPLSFFSQVELGYWLVPKHEEAEGEEHSEVEYENNIITGRLWNSFALSDAQELEFGLNYLLGNNSADSNDEKQSLAAIDLTFNQDISSDQSLKLQLEYLEANFGEEGEARAKQSGGYISGFYKFNRYYQTGIRYGILGKHGDEGKEQNQWSILLTRQLTETSKFRVQYNTGEEIENTVLAQFIFGMGPHSHVLQ